MDSKTFFYLVERMRFAQKQFAKTHSQSSQSECRQLERMVDNEIDRVYKEIGGNKPQQQSLF